MPTALENNIGAYHAEFPRLTARFPLGFFALFAGAVFVNAYPTYAEAVTAGYEQTDDDYFLVKQIASADEDIQSVATPFTK